MLQACLSERKWGGDQGTLEALLGFSPRLRELRLEDSPAIPLPLLHQTPATLFLPPILDA